MMPASDDDNLFDAGSALNFSDILTFDGLKSKKITIVNLNPESNCFWRKGISYVFFTGCKELFWINQPDLMQKILLTD